MFLRMIRCTTVKDLDAGLKLMREERAPAWHRMMGYRLSVIHQAPKTGEIWFINLWDTEEDERASHQAIMPICEQVTEVLAPAHVHEEAYRRVIMARAPMQPEAGSLVRTIELEGIAGSTMEAMISSYEEWVSPELLDHPGFQACFFAVDRELGRAMAVSYWTDEASLHGSESTVDRVRKELAEGYDLRVVDITFARLLLADAPAQGIGRSESAQMSPADTHVEPEHLGDGTIVILRVKGSLDRFSSPRIKNILGRAMEAGTADLVLDLSGVMSLDSSGVGVLVGTLKRARRAGGDLRLAGENHKVSTILRTMSLDNMLPQDRTVEDAITYFRSSGKAV